MESVSNNNRSFSLPNKQSTKKAIPLSPPPQNQQSLVKNTPIFKFKFTIINRNRFAIKEKDHNNNENNYNSKDQSSDRKTMAALQRFKLLATQCGVAQSPTRSPRTSPVVHLRRRKTTLRMLLGRSRSSGCRSPPRRRDSYSAASVADQFRLLEEKAPAKRNSLKELFVSSPPPLEVGGGGGRRNSKEDGESVQVVGNGKEESNGGGLTGLQGGPGSPRPVFMGFRYRSLLRRAWRPMLVSIPE
ncbi:hypothetical protein TorRG33x02_172120 [Trema orientale]|uniref:Uncharacterized protein n=1 Tax=Trema orientale TaxID=63057 RepID=A0A2P5ENC1_TREOI|nr:hypothetical protein TorRG33x02_172120 [Trema orientale]